MRRAAHSLRNRVATFVGLLLLVSLLGSSWTLVRVGGVNSILKGLAHSWLGLGRELSHLQSDSGGLKIELEKGLAYRHWADLALASLQGGRVVNSRRFESPQWLFQSLDRSFEKVLAQVEAWEAAAFVKARDAYLERLKRLRSELKDIELSTDALVAALDEEKWAEAQKLYPGWNRSVAAWSSSVEQVVSDWERVSREILENTQGRIDDLRGGLKLSLLSAVLLSLLLLWLAERALRPLGHLSQLARKIAQRGLDRDDKELLSQFSVHRSDEVSLLARDFHSMASALLERERVVNDQTSQLEEQNRQLREVSRLRERLREAESRAAIGRLSAQVAHEVRNPLHAIGLEAELALEKAQALGDSQLKQSLLSIIESVERLSKITENYLKFSRPSEGRAKRFDLGEALDSVLATYASECEKLKIRVDWTRSPGGAVIEVLADRDALEQALGNLMRNSIQALESLPDASRQIFPPRICWALGIAESGRPWMSIQDNGPGISKQMRDKLFAPFSTTKAQGTGLGLSWVKRVIEEQGGEVQVHDRGLSESQPFEESLSESRPGAGFSVILARAPELSAPLAEVSC
ncbi:MAG: sensor histidine kinase [Oligoflexia bacterium]